MVILQGFLFLGEGHPVGGRGAGCGPSVEPPAQVRPQGLQPDDEHPGLAPHTLRSCRYSDRLNSTTTQIQEFGSVHTLQQKLLVACSDHTLRGCR